EFPLLGPKAGGTAFKLGPAFYYLEYFSGAIFGSTPGGIALFIPIFSIASIFLFYLFFKNIFSTKITLALTLLYASSFYLIKYSRFAWNPNAIPFFLFAFLNLSLAILLSKRPLYYHITLAAVVAIGIQLHTTLLILLPIFTFGLYTYLIIKNKKVPLIKICAVLFTIAFLNVPFFLNDIKKDGENLRNFFSGAASKTESSTAIISNIKNSFNFLAQGTAYSLTGLEPQKNWSKPVKLLQSGNITEIAAAFLAILITFFGIFLAVLKIKNEKTQSRKTALYFIASISIISLLLFTALGDELNIRFFIVIIFLPFMFLGFSLEYLSNYFKDKSFRLAIIIITILLLTFTSLNIAKYVQVYDLETSQKNTSAYGGISVGESRGISEYIKETLENYPDSKPYTFPFEFKRSLDYFNSKSGISVHSFSANNLADKSILFLVAEKESAEKSLDKLNGQFDVLEQKNIGRFTIFKLLPKYQ
ncbi:MAG: hypothetical protein ACD_5C00120G0001, partial [uncultured bacterium]